MSRNYPQPTGIYVSATVVLSRTPKGDTDPVADIKVRLSGPGGNFEKPTDGRGKCFFDHLGKGNKPTDYVGSVTYKGETQSHRGHHLTFHFVDPDAGNPPGKKPSDVCNDQNAVRFVQTHLEDCKALAAQLGVPVENVLGLAAQESEHGRGRIAREYNNFFSMHADSPLQIGVGKSLSPPYTPVSIYASFRQGGESFVKRFGDAVRGKQDPTDFARALVRVNFNTGKSSTGGRDGFVPYLVGIIEKVRQRMDCPALK